MSGLRCVSTGSYPIARIDYSPHGSCGVDRPTSFHHSRGIWVRLRDTHVPSPYGRREPPGLSLAGAVRGSRCRTSGAVLHASTRCRFQAACPFSRTALALHSSWTVLRDCLFSYPVETLDVLWSTRYPCRHGIDSIPLKGPTGPPSLSILGSFDPRLGG